MKTLPKMEIVSIGLMMFSIFFGAGNLIFPTSLGQAAGEHLLLSIGGFLTTGVGLPLLGVIAIAHKGGAYPEFMKKSVSPMFTTVLLTLLYLTIGPLFAIPRTGAVSFEIGIRPFLSEDSLAVGQAVYTGVFFFLTYWLALNPSKIVARVGKFLTPFLLLFLVALFVQVFARPMGNILPAVGAYVENPFIQGFKDGYLTMDLLASLAVGAIVVQSVHAAGVTDRKEVGKVCLFGGLLAVTLMSVVYLSLGYLGATSASVLGISPNGGVILSSASAFFFGASGQLLLAVIIGFACLTTSIGLASACSAFFREISHDQIAYQRILLVSVLFSFAASNVGLTQLIQLSVPFLITMYPVVIVLVFLSLADGIFGGKRSVYCWSLAFTLAFSVFGGLGAAGIKWATLDALFAAYVPFYEAELGWLLPAFVGAVIGGVLPAGEAAGEKSAESLAKEV